MVIRLATVADWDAIWRIWHAVVEAGETYAWPPGTAKADAESLWMLPPPAEVWVAVDDAGAVAASALLKPNQPGLGDHVANASFMVDPTRSGEGFGRALAQSVIDRATEVGYRGMQFNAVVATNIAAVALWESLGFATVGRIPEAFRHPIAGFVDFLVMYRAL